MSLPLLTLFGLIAAPVAADIPATLQAVAVAPDYPGRLPGDERWLIYLDGPVDPGATSRVVSLILTEHITNAVVYLNSPGGVQRSLEKGSAVRLHRAENRVPLGDEDAFQHVVRTQVVAYLAEMGVRAEVANIMEAIPHDRIRDLTVDEALQLNLVNERR